MCVKIHVKRNKGVKLFQWGCCKGVYRVNGTVLPEGSFHGRTLRGGVTFSGGGKYRINWTSGPKPFQWGYFSSLTNVSMGLGWNLCTVVKGPWDKYVYKKYKTSQKISKEIHHKTFVCPSEGCDKLFKGILPPPQFPRKNCHFWRS